MPRYGVRRRESHEKSMGSYELFAWRDAMSIADYVASEYGAAKARKVFESFKVEAVIGFEKDASELLRDFIQKPESQRPAFLGRITKDVGQETRILFLVLAILGVIRAKEIMELRDRFRMVLAPGGGNRATTSEIYEFSNEIRDTYSYQWPWEPFDALGINDDVDDEEADESIGTYDRKDPS